MLHTKYQGSRPYGFRQEDFFHVFPYIGLCKTSDHRGGGGGGGGGGGQFWPQGHNLNKLGKGPLGDASYQISRL